MSKQPVKVTIKYCAECGYGHEAIALTQALMDEFQLWLTSIEIVPWYNGAYDVLVNDDLVHSMYRDGGFPAPETIFAAIRERLGTSVEKDG